MAGKKAKGNRVQVILECTEMKESGLPGTSRYITTKNRKNTPERMELKKYNPILKRMTVKTVATLHEGSKDGRAYTKVIKMVKSPKTGAYIFDEQMVPNEDVKDFFKN